jgi:hypothetical protein
MNQILHQNWYLFIATLSGQSGSLRLRFWRQLKAIGAANLRDGVYLLPAQSTLRPILLTLSDEVFAAGGKAWLLDVPAQGADTEQEWQALFDRSASYLEWQEKLSALLEKLAEFTESEARRQLRQFGKELNAIIEIDFFPQAQGQQARSAYAEAEKRLTREYSPDEPESAAGNIPQLTKGDFQQRVWATRKRPWVDRLASAWLIQRFIDPQARFIWLDTPGECPADAIGFDFDGASFAHVGDSVTFETLAASFGLNRDPALAYIARIVHFLDVGGVPVAEAAGVEAMIDGMRTALTNDDELFAAAARAFDFLYQSSTAAGT